MDPKEIAKLAADRSRIRYTIGREMRNRVSMPEQNSATYDSYLADSEQHFVITPDGRKVGARQILTNAGLDKGDPVEFVDKHLDAMPRSKPDDVLDPVPPAPEPQYAVLIRLRAYVTTQSRYLPPSEAVYSDPVPASFCMIYYSNASGDGLPAGWDPSAPIRYSLGTSLELCGSHYTNPITNFNSDPYCRTSMAAWAQIPSSLVGGTGFAATGCHFAFAGLPQDSAGRYFYYGGKVIGCLAFAGDGVAAAPTTEDLPVALPTVHFKLFDTENEYPDYNYQPCDVGQGAEVDLAWELVEALQLSEYVPPQLITPPFPGGTFYYPVYEQQFWLLTPQGAVKVLTVPDYIPEEGTPGSYPWDVTGYVALDENSVAHCDFKVTPIDTATGDLLPVVLRHFEVRGGGASEVDTSASWRRQLTNSTTEVPLPGTYSHPCVQSYQAQANANIIESQKRLTRVNQIVDMTDIIAGGTFDLDVWDLPPSAVCNLPFEPDDRKQITLPPLDDGAIGRDEQDHSIHFLGFVAYVE